MKIIKSVTEQFKNPWANFLKKNQISSILPDIRSSDLSARIKGRDNLSTEIGLH